MNKNELKSLKRKVVVDIENMKEKYNSMKTNHAFHLFLCFFTGGLWLLAWLIVSYTNTKERERLEKDIREAQDALFQIEDQLDELN